MKRIYLVFFTCLLLIPLGFAVAVAMPSKSTNLKTHLILEQLKVVRPGEYNDELYFDIRVVRKNQEMQYIQIPQKPVHWTSSMVAQLKKVRLWSGALNKNEEVKLTISLCEYDPFQLNVDDQIGVINIILKNEKGKLQPYWHVINQNNKQKSVNKVSDGHKGIQKFKLYGKHGKYDVYLSVK